ncbi:MAG: hypothetical protein ACK4F9_00230 [Brevinematia bacterium]
MGTILKIVYFTLLILITLILVFFISAFSSFYNNIKYLGISSVILQDSIVIITVIFILSILPFVFFLLRTKLAIISFQNKAEISDYHKKVLFISDIIAFLFVTVFVILNLKSIYFTLFIPYPLSSIFNISDYPFVLRFSRFLLEYLFIVFLYLILPILYLCHKSYTIRFLGFSIVPHRSSFPLIITLFLFILFVSTIILAYSFLFSIEFHHKYSLILTLGIALGIILLAYAFYFLLSLLRNLVIPWYLNFVIFVLLILYLVSIALYNRLPNISIIRFEFLDKIESSFNSSKFVLKIDKVNVSDVFDGIDINKLEKLRNIKIQNYHFIKKEPVVKIVRKAKFLERIFILISSGTVDYSFKENLVVTNYIDFNEVAKWLFPMSFTFSFFINGTNYFEISFPYEFGDNLFFYKRYVIFWTSENDLNFSDLRTINENMELSTFTSKDYYLITKKLYSQNKIDKLFIVDSKSKYLILGDVGMCVLLSNENYTAFYLNSDILQETFLFLDGVPLFVSNIFMDDKIVGYKVRYFDISGRGMSINEGISNLIGNAIYYYKVIDLTNRIEKLKKYLNENKDSIPPDIFEKLKGFLPE